MTMQELFVASNDTDTQRVCGTCGKLKPVDEFYRDGKDSHGKIRYRRDCKDCYKMTRVFEKGLKTKTGRKV